MSDAAISSDDIKLLFVSEFDSFSSLRASRSAIKAGDSANALVEEIPGEVLKPFKKNCRPAMINKTTAATLTTGNIISPNDGKIPRFFMPLRIVERLDSVFEILSEKGRLVI